MKTLLLILVFILPIAVLAQEKLPPRSSIGLGASAPEMFHVAYNYRIANASLIAVSGGIGPSAGEAWYSLSLEHRLYFGKTSSRNNRKAWFCRQGSTFFPRAVSKQKFTANLTAGKDFPAKSGKTGFTLDAGFFFLPDSEESSVILVRPLNLWPALRFQFYFHP